MIEFNTVITIISGLVLIGGVGYKLNGELSKIRTIIEVFIAKTEAQWGMIKKLEERLDEKINDVDARLKVIETKMIMKKTQE